MLRLLMGLGRLGWAGEMVLGRAMRNVRISMLVAGAFASTVAFVIALAFRNDAVAYGTAFSAFAFSVAGIYAGWRNIE